MIIIMVASLCLNSGEGHISILITGNPKIVVRSERICRGSVSVTGVRRHSFCVLEKSRETNAI